MAMTEERARGLLGDAIKPDGLLFSLGRYISWSPEEVDKGKSYSGYEKSENERGPGRAS